MYFRYWNHNVVAFDWSDRLQSWFKRLQYSIQKDLILSMLVLPLFFILVNNFSKCVNVYNTIYFHYHPTATDDYANNNDGDCVRILCHL